METWAEHPEQCPLLDTAGTTAQAVPVQALPLPAAAHVIALLLPLKMQQPSPLPHIDSGGGLSAALTPQTRNGGTLGHIMSLLGTEHVAQTWP